MKKQLVCLLRQPLVFLNLQPCGDDFSIRAELRKVCKSGGGVSDRFELLTQVSLIRILLEKNFRDFF